jgi:hypothetical protein
MAADLDAEGSERYTFDQDYKFAINSAMERMISLFNSAFAQNKLTPEALRDLTKIKIWQVSQYSRFTFDANVIGHPYWTIFGIYPKPTVNKGVSGIPLPQKDQSVFRPDLSFVSSDKSAKRLNFEQWNQNRKNAFMPGNIILSGELAEYSYLDSADYSSSSYQTVGEMEVRPEIPGELIAVAYLKYPNQVSTIGDTIEFPESLTELIVEFALNVIAIKQGDNTSIYSITERDIMKLVNLIR